MEQDDSLQEVAQSEIPQVLEALKKDWPKHFLLHQMITIMEEKKNSEVKLPQVLYRLGDIDTGVYILQTKFQTGSEPRVLFNLYTTVSNADNVCKAVTMMPLLPKKYLFEVTASRFTPAIQQGLTLRGFNPEANSTIMMWLPPTTTVHTRVIPDNTYLDFLDDSHVPEVDKNWPYRQPGSEQYLLEALRNNFGLGLFRKSDKKMLCSALSFHSGGIFVLYTNEDFRGHGYAEIIVQNMVKEIRQRRRIPFATIVVSNIPSQNLFKKIGFEEFYPADFIYNPS